MQRILSFSASPRRMLDSSASKAMLRAFFFSGRFRISQAMPAFSSMLALMSLVSAIVLLRNFKVQNVQAVQIVSCFVSCHFEVLRNTQDRLRREIFSGRIFHFVRLCENYVHGSTALTTNEMASLESKYLSVRPEHRRRAPREFSDSL